MPQYQAVKDLRHDNKLVYAGAVVPNAWVEEWDGYGNNTVAKMRRNQIIQLLPGDEQLEEAVPVDLAVGSSAQVAPSTSERAAMHQFLDKMSERDALQYVRDNNLALQVGVTTEVDPSAVDVAATFESDTEPFDEETLEFNPTENSVAQVKEFVEEHPETAGDVMDAEYNGRNRKTLIAWLEEFIEAQPDGEGETEPVEPVDPDADDNDDEDDDPNA